MNPVLQLRDLICAYGSGPTVLTVPEIDIIGGELVFVVGVSGGGKSTLLETVGLMNRTLNAGGEIAFYTPTERYSNLTDFWDEKGTGLDDFRRQHYSFIFQKTNLMPNFTCGENMLLPVLLKGQDFKVAKDNILSYMNQLGLEADIFDKKIVNISGGQRQRLAFIRAMAADFSLLFGDEPTGNLDPNTARKVMSVLREHLLSTGKTGIVVSHDISLATDFADRIIPITMTQTTDYAHGTVLAKNVLLRTPNGWADPTTTYSDPLTHLQQLIA